MSQTVVCQMSNEQFKGARYSHLCQGKACSHAMRWAASDKHPSVIDKFSKVNIAFLIPYRFACVETLPVTNPWGGQLPLAGCAGNRHQS